MSGAAAQDVVTLTDALSVDTKLTVHDAVRTVFIFQCVTHRVWGVTDYLVWSLSHGV